MDEEYEGNVEVLFVLEKKELDAEVHRKYIFGGHVATYMKA
jgi:large subunit ribosomal protein L5e